jgi:hypothetical protein
MLLQFCLARLRSVRTLVLEVPVPHASVALQVASVAANARDDWWRSGNWWRRLTMSSSQAFFIEVGLSVDQLLLDYFQGQVGQGWPQVHIIHVYCKQSVPFIMF